jgi:hypothetical protein
MDDTDIGTDAGTLVITGAKAPRLEFGFSLGFSLYQHVMSVARSVRPGSGGETVDARWLAAATKLSELYFPLGPLNYFEFAMLQAGTVAELAEGLRARTTEFATALPAALQEVEQLYRETLWPGHRALLAEAAGELERLLGPTKDRLLDLQATRLGVTLTSSHLQITLVPGTHEPTGAYSHPTVVSVSKFRGLRLVEAVLHEVGHVLSSNDAGPGSTYGAIRAACERRGRSDRDASQLFHLVLFHASGALVREELSPSYVPYASELGIYQRVATALRADLAVETVERIWSAWTRGELPLATAMQEFVDKIGRA